MSSDATIPEFVIFLSEKGGVERKLGFRASSVTFGRVAGNDVVLGKGNVSKRHARLTFAEGRFVVSDLNSTNGTYVNRQRISQPTILRDEDRVQIGDFTIHMELGVDDGPVTPGRDVPDAPPPPLKEAELLAGMSPAHLTTHSAPHHSSNPPREENLRSSIPAVASRPDGSDSVPSQRNFEHGAALRKSVALVWERAEKLGLVEVTVDSKTVRDKRDKISQIVDQLLVDGLIPVGTSPGSVLEQAYLELCDWGPLRESIRDANVSSISALRHDELIEVRDGRAQVSSPGFSSNHALQIVLDRIFARSKEVVTKPSTTTATLEGAKITRLSGEYAGDGPLFVVEKTKRSTSSLDELVRRGTISRSVATFLGQIVQARLNVLVVGPKDEGASAVLGALAHAATLGPIRERIVCAAEFEDVDLDRDSIFQVKLPCESEPLRDILGVIASVPGTRLVAAPQSAAKMAGCLVAVGANMSGMLVSFRAAGLDRLLLRLPADLAATLSVPTPVAADYLASTFDIVLEVSRLRDGRVRVLRVAELELDDRGRLHASDIFRFTVTRLAAGGAVEGTFSPSGTVPRCLGQLQLQGMRVETSSFSRPPSK